MQDKERKRTPINFSAWENRYSFFCSARRLLARIPKLWVSCSVAKKQGSYFGTISGSGPAVLMTVMGIVVA